MSTGIGANGSRIAAVRAKQLKELFKRPVKMKLQIVPIFQDEAFEFISQYHRHHKKPVGSLFQIAAAEEAKGTVGCQVRLKITKRQNETDKYNTI
jgi:hypothetical protein